MSGPVTIAVGGDYDPSAETHQATDVSLGHAAAALGIDLAHRWVPTTVLASDAQRELLADTGLLVAPGSPYASMEGALAAIWLAREGGVPLLGTCGGFQHVVIEYARSLLGFREAQHAEYDLTSSTLFVTPLSCSLAGLRTRVHLEPGSRAAAWYGAAETEERYYCNFGLNPEHQAGLDADGEARVLELPGHSSYAATLFVPQTRSEPGRPHPLVLAFVRAAAELSSARERD